MAEHVWKMGDWFRKKAIGNAPSEIFRFICQDNFDEDCGKYMDFDRSFWSHKYSQMEHLPDCDSFDWQPTPKLQLREGAWYERADGKVVGPSRRRSLAGLRKRDNSLYPWGIDHVWYSDCGVVLSESRSHDIIREVHAPAPKVEAPKGYRLLTLGEIILASDMWFDRYWDSLPLQAAAIGCGWDARGHMPIARKIEPRYRPFANAAEFKPHRDRWLTNKDGKLLLGRVCTYSETDCWFVGVFGEYSGNWERCFKHIVFDDTKLPFGVEVQS